MKFETIPIPPTDYREVARAMEHNVKILKEDITEHINNELERFHNELNYKFYAGTLPDYPRSTKSTQYSNETKET